MALLKEIRKDTLRREWRLISMLFAELVVIVLIVVQALQVIGLNVDFFLKQVVFNPSTSPIDFVVLALAIIIFILLYFEVKKKMPALYQAQKRAPGIIKEEAKKKLRKIKYEPQAPALLVIEILFVATVVLALHAYFDPEIELIPWSKVGLEAPFTTLINTLIAVVVLAVFYYMYRATAAYRKK